ncbi:MAG: hypothetical protein EOO61_09245 [Hymenobacter sp.]|nr:MAG: hypothetical protein EOO61_09245 [Hymenobacter sp.]
MAGGAFVYSALGFSRKSVFYIAAMFDKFEPFRKLDKTESFSFAPSRFETWFEGQMISSGLAKSAVDFIPVVDEGEEKIRVMVYDRVIFEQMKYESVFDEFISSNDRLQLVTLPAQTNTGCMGVMALKMAVGPTRDSKEFGPDEPYCCNLFLTNKKIVKISFVFSNPEKMIELYS